MRGIEVFWKILSHFGHFFIIYRAPSETVSSSDYFKRGYASQFPIQYSQKFAKQFCWLQATAFQIIWLHIEPKFHDNYKQDGLLQF